ncbi:hypothetical protein B0T25DRAFT_302096 [Lasiosphaeria hispida]|uniref:Uncharacterized protein n=1 Tax=Lasiosphaeria hispida TaxID=260671 RepID=A0AAJ0M937_9PEZI|nr:hypothetical protein B0T25DRAFT_302096 [Lasiosphaeria hispida]
MGCVLMFTAAAPLFPARQLPLSDAVAPFPQLRPSRRLADHDQFANLFPGLACSVCMHGTRAHVCDSILDPHRADDVPSSERVNLIYLSCSSPLEPPVRIYG